MEVGNSTGVSIRRGVVAVVLCGFIFLLIYGVRVGSGIDLLGSDTLRICGRSWIDVDGSGLQKGGEFGGDYNLGGVQVTLSGSNGFQQSTTTSSTSGNYFFEDLPSGDYELSFSSVAGYLYTESVASVWESGPRLSVVDENTGKTAVFRLPDDSNTRGGDHCSLLNIDVGYKPLKAAQEQEYSAAMVEDSDKNVESAIRDEVIGNVGEKISISLAQSSSAPNFSISLDHTDVPGEVSIDGGNEINIINTSAPGSYIIRYRVNNETETDGSMELSVTLIGSPVSEYSICGRAFNDLNKSNLQDSDDSVFNGVSVSLFSDRGARVRGPQITFKGGKYEFLGLDSGEYYVEFELPESHESFVDTTVGNNPQWDSDVNSSGFTRVVNVPADSNSGEKKSAQCTINWLDAGIR